MQPICPESPLSRPLQRPLRSDAVRAPLLNFTEPGDQRLRFAQNLGLGVVTRLTLATHKLPQVFGAVRLTLRAHSEDAFRRLLACFIDLYAANLFNPHWGEQVTTEFGNRLDVAMVFQGLTQDEAAAWKPLLDFVSANSADYEGHGSFAVTAIPARSYWDAGVMRRTPGTIVSDPRPGAAPTDFSWPGDETVGCWSTAARSGPG